MGLKISDLSFGYQADKKILDGISLEMQDKEILGIIGPNGTGKTTFIKCINNILRPQTGEVILNDRRIGELEQEEIAKLIAYVPQYTNSFFSMTVIDMVMMGRVPYTRNSYSAKDKEIVFDIIKKMDLEKFAFRNITQMSGGERQRVFIARALAQQPQLIILDEPTSSLDLHNQLFILHIISALVKENDVSIIMTIHDLNLASMFCDKLLMLKDAHVFGYGKAQHVLTEDNITKMYNVNTKITVEDGYKHIRLLKNIAARNL